MATPATHDNPMVNMHPFGSEPTIRITHKYDIGDQSIYVERYKGDVDPKRACLYVHFMFEHYFGPTEELGNLSIGAALIAFYGFRQTGSLPDEECTTVDIYADRAAACGEEAIRIMADASLQREGLREFLTHYFQPGA